MLRLGPLDCGWRVRYAAYKQVTYTNFAEKAVDAPKNQDCFTFDEERAGCSEELTGAAMIDRTYGIVSKLK